MNLLERYKKVQFSPKKYRYLEWIEGRGDNGKQCTAEGKTGQMWIQRQDHECSSDPVQYTTTR